MAALELLQQIADNTASNRPFIAVVVTAVSAILVAALTSFLSYRAESKRISADSEKIKVELKASLVTAERVRWLRELREKVSAVYTNMDMQHDLLRRTGISQQILDEYSMKVMNDVHHISLMADSQSHNFFNLKRALSLQQQIIMKCFNRANAGLPQIHEYRYTTVKRVAFRSMEAISAETWRQIKELS